MPCNAFARTRNFPSIYLGTGMDKATLSVKQHKVWYFLDHVQDSFWPISQWPQWTQFIAMIPHKNDSQVFNLMFFLLANGLYPQKAMQWALMADTHQAYPVKGVYSMKEVNDAARILQRHASGDLYQKKKKVYDMISGRPILM